MITVLLATVLAAAPPQQLDTTLTVRAGSRLAVENMTGTVVVRSWDRDEMRIRASNNRQVEIDADRSEVNIETSSRYGMPESVDFEITVPRRFDVEVEGINLTAEVHDVTGDVDVETVNGNITLSGLDGRVHVETVQGQLTVNGARGRLDAESANGGITIDDFDGEITADAINGPLTLRRIRSASVEAETVNGPIEYDGQIRDDGRYRFASHAGSVTLFVPENTNAAVTVETFRGEVEADFPIQVRGVGRREEMSFTLGNGSARIEIESFGGRVHLRRPTGGGL
jgi:DUF4097 and DUF4098 domain-containing protein YvlB